MLLQTPAAVRWVSYEPALGPVDFRHIHYDNVSEIDSLTGDHGVYRPLTGRSDANLDWIVAGGESGPGARPMHPDWARNVMQQCKSANVPFFMKQICERGRKIQWEQFPKDLQVREYPNAER
jgi:protein gp37